MARDCPTCGRTNADGKDFCDCGEYLRWDPTGVFAVPAQAAGVAAPATPAAPALPAHATSAPPTPIPAEPVLLVLRAPGTAPGDGPPTIPLAVGTSGLLQGFVRNQTKRVDSYSLRVNGLPEQWVEISPPAVDLLPYGASGDAHESHFLVTITPPRDPTSRAGRHDFRFEAVSRATGAVVASVPGAIEIQPYFELQLEALPEVRGGRRRVRFTATAETTGNAPIEVELGARDREERFDLSFSPPTLLLEPNTPTDAQLTAKPRRPHWIGRPREQTLAVTAHAPGVAPPPTQIVAVRQKAWLPLWLPPVLLLLAALAAAFVLTRPETATMPELTGETFNAAQLATARAGFTQTPVQQTRRASRRADIGKVIAQEPAAGEDAPRDAKLVLVVGVSREQATVPDLKGMDLDQAQAALRRAKLKLGPANGDGVKGVVARQAPQPGEKARAGTGVTVWLATPETKPKPAPPTDEPDTPLSLADLRTLAIADAKGIWIDPPGTNDSLRLNTETGDSDPTWLGDRVAFQRAGRLFVVDADEQAEPEPLTDDDGWSSPTAVAGTLAAIRDEQICIDENCRKLPGVERIAWGSEGASLTALVNGTQVLRFAADGDDPSTWPAPEEIGTVEDALYVAVSPEGTTVASTAKGLERLGDGPIVPDIDSPCSIDFLDATRLAVACGGQIRLADIESGATRALDGDRGAQIAFK
jgi:hypothetical protein